MVYPTKDSLAGVGGKVQNKLLFDYYTKITVC